MMMQVPGCVVTMFDSQMLASVSKLQLCRWRHKTTRVSLESFKRDHERTALQHRIDYDPASSQSQRNMAARKQRNRRTVREIPPTDV